MMEATDIDQKPPLAALHPPAVGRRFTSTQPSTVGLYVVTYSGVGEDEDGPTNTSAASDMASTPAPAEAAPADLRLAADHGFGGSFDERPLGLWAAAGVLQRGFGRRSGGRLISASQLLTPSWRVEQPQAVATLVARDPVSLLTWSLLTLLATCALSIVLAHALLGSILAIAVIPVLFVVDVTVTSGLAQRVNARKTADRRRGALVVANVTADPKGHGHGTALMATIVNFADRIGRDLVLLVDPTNEPAVRLYRSCGFVAEDDVHRRRIRMVRPASTGAEVRAALPSWLVPIRVGRWTVVGAAVVGAALVALYWNTPAAWLMAPFVAVATLAAENDARTLRIPNRLVAVGATVMALTIGFVAVAFGAVIVWPAIGGAAIFAVPLFVSHALSHGRSGLGDVKLAAVFGLVAGAVNPKASLGALIVSLLLGSVFGLLWGRRRRGGFPLGPALAVGTTVVLALWAVLEGATTW